MAKSSGVRSVKTPSTPRASGGGASVPAVKTAMQRTDTRGGGNNRVSGVSTSWATWSVPKGTSKLSTGGAGRRVLPPVP